MECSGYDALELNSVLVLFSSDIHRQAVRVEPALASDQFETQCWSSRLFDSTLLFMPAGRAGSIEDGR